MKKKSFYVNALFYTKLTEVPNVVRSFKNVYFGELISKLNIKCKQQQQIHFYFTSSQRMSSKDLSLCENFNKHVFIHVHI